MQLLSFLAAALLASCGAGQQHAQQHVEAPSEPPPSETAAPSPNVSSADGIDAAGADDAGGETPSDEPTEAERLAEAERQRRASAPEPREVVYRVTPQGLIIEVAGVRFKPKAEAVKKSNGGYGIALSVEAEATDDETHTLLSPEHGPLALAATIIDKDGNQQAQHSDTRQGEEQQFITPGSKLEFSRKWPSGSVKGPLWWGQTVRLEVGLWGLGAAGDEKAASPRPVRKLFVVEMVAGAEARAIISPPEV